ncbi:MAG TPA: tetratricopeptide repeat protein [Caldilineaceae bacterium]|nr:tetratricopeptide repeat protein [Caldilineaceae bacterium]
MFPALPSMHTLRTLLRGSLIRTRSLWIFGKARWLVGLALAALGTLGTLLGVPELNQQMRTEIPGLRCWFPVPMDDAKFTVALAPFVEVDINGRVRITGDGRELARLLFARLEAGFEELELDVPYELRSPDQTCPVKGADRETRAAAAETAAATLGADVLIYGALVQEAAPDAGAVSQTAQLQPEFYVSYRGFAEAADLVGPYDLGRSLRVNVPVRSRDLEGIADHPVNTRARALALIALGLASYAVDDYQQAYDYFAAAEAVPNWPDSAGKELIYLLLGNASSNLATITLDSIYAEEALDHYDRALAIEPAFARALVGMAGATYQLALGDLETRRSSGVDPALLDEAEALYRQALNTPAPEAAEIPLKVHFGLGQVFLVRHYLYATDSEADGWLEQARAEFQSIVNAYESGQTSEGDKTPVRNTDIVGHAYARLGLIAAQFDQDPAAAIPLYEQAVRLVTPRWQAFYQIDLGDLYARQNDPDAARSHFEEALAIAELYGNEEMVQRAETRLAELPSP